MSKSDRYIKQGSFLAITSIMVRIIGMLYRIPMTTIIGDRGNGLYAGAFEIYNIILLISTYSMPMAVSKVVSAKLANKDYLNTYRFFKISLYFSFVIGASLSLLAFLGADFLAGDLLKSPMSAIALRVLAPTILVVSIMGTLRGLFQGTGSMIPTSISQIIEQLVNAVLSVVAANYLFNYGLRLAKATGNGDFPYAYGAAGGTLGTFVGALCALIFLGFIALVYISYIKKKINKSKNYNLDSIKDMFLSLIFTIFPVILSTAVYNINTILSQGIYYHTMYSSNISPSVYESMWGIYSGKFNLLCNVPIAVASAMSASIVPTLSMIKSRGASYYEINYRLKNTLKMVMLIVIPCIVGLSVLSHPIITMLFGSDGNEFIRASTLLKYGAIMIFPIALSTLTTGFLQGLSKMKEPVIHSFIALILQLLLFRMMLTMTNLGIYTMIISNVFFTSLVFFMNMYTLKKTVGYRIEIFSAFIKPIFASLLMGGFAYLFYKLLFMVTHRNSISLLITILLSMFTYFVLIIILRVVNKREMKQLPKGRSLVRIGEKIRLW